MQLLGELESVEAVGTDGRPSDELEAVAGPGGPAAAPDGPAGPAPGPVPPKAVTFAGLPPLPAPNAAVRRRQALGGCAVVLGAAAVCLGATYAAALATPALPPAACAGALAAVSAWACGALVCLGGLLGADPGTVPRTEATALPLPGPVLQQLAAGQPPPSNVREGGRTYCVRCFVWRPPDPPPAPPPAAPGRGGPCRGRWRARRPRATHHCRICQRCVREFDHHCGVFGRCIAGRGLRGNMPYFVGILAMGYLGGLTTAVTVLACLALHFGWWACLVVAPGLLLFWMSGWCPKGLLRWPWGP